MDDSTALRSCRSRSRRAANGFEQCGGAVHSVELGSELLPDLLTTVASRDFGQVSIPQTLLSCLVGRLCGLGKLASGDCPNTRALPRPC